MRGERDWLVGALVAWALTLGWAVGAGTGAGPWGALAVAVYATILAIRQRRREQKPGRHR